MFIRMRMSNGAIACKDLYFFGSVLNTLPLHLSNYHARIVGLLFALLDLHADFVSAEGTYRIDSMAHLRENVFRVWYFSLAMLTELGVNLLLSPSLFRPLRVRKRQISSWYLTCVNKDYSQAWGNIVTGRNCLHRSRCTITHWIRIRASSLPLSQRVLQRQSNPSLWTRVWMYLLYPRWQG